MSHVSTAVFSGDPHERGVAHGEAFSEAIEHNAAFYFDHFADNGVDSETALDHAEEFVGTIEEMNPDYVAEMRGVAEGSGRPMEEITLINIRHTILYSAYGDDGDRGGSSSDDDNADGSDTDGKEIDAPDSADAIDGCTSFGVQPERSVTGTTIIGQNWDWEADVESLVMDVRQDDGPNFLAVTEAGMVGGKFGLNEHGIGFVVNGLNTPADGEHIYRKPAHVRGREILDATRLDEAFGAVVGTERPTSRNYLVAHESGDMIDLETTPDDCEYVYPDDGLLTHANHFEHADVTSTLERQIPHTLCRGARVRRLMERHDRIGETEIKAVLRDHTHYPKGICRHVSEDNASHTNHSVIMDLSERRLLATEGPPCESDYEAFEVTPSS